MDVSVHIVRHSIRSGESRVLVTVFVCQVILLTRVKSNGRISCIPEDGVKKAHHQRLPVKPP